MSNSVNCPKCGGHVPSGAAFCQACGASVSGASAMKPRQPEKAKRSNWKGFLIGGLALVVVISAAAFGFRSKPASQAEAPIDPNFTAIEGVGPMPAYLAKADPLIKTEYIWAASHLKELQYIPCYCGCFHEDGHTDNFSCYYERDKSGRITGYDGMSVS